MTIEIVFETHSTTEDNEKGSATGWRPGKGTPLESLLAAGFEWQPGWEYRVG